MEVTEDVSGIDLQILNGAKFSGKIIYPEGKAAEEDLSGKLYIRNEYYYKESDFVIKKGDSSASFEYTLPKDLKEFTFAYSVDADINPTMGYYTDKGTTLDYLGAQKLSVKTDRIENLQFFIRNNNIVFGQIFIPQEMGVDKNQIFHIAAMAKNADGIYAEVGSTDCIVPPSEQGSMIAPIYRFQFFVPAYIDEVIIKCNVSSELKGDPLVLGGYLGEDGIVFDKEKAKIINPAKFQENDIIIIPVKGERIWGSIQVNDEIKDYTTKGFSLEYNFVNHNEEPDSIGVREFAWEDKQAFSQKFFMNIPPIYMGEKFTLKLRMGDREDQEFYIGEDGLTKDEKKAKLFTCDCVDIKDLKVVVNTTSSIVYGDLNNDGGVNAIDFAKYKQYLLEMIGEDEIAITNADLNKDGATNAIDFAILRKYLLGIINELPVK